MDQALTPQQKQRAIGALRNGGNPDNAAIYADVHVSNVYAAARTDTDLALALAGHDPYAHGSARVLQQADYLRLLALGMRPTQASRVLFDGDERVSEWRVENPTFGEMADALVALRPAKGSRSHRFDRERVQVFLEQMRAGASAKKAAQVAGVTNAVIYQRRRRDPEFKDLMDQARAQGAAPAVAQAAIAGVTAEQWEKFAKVRQRGHTLYRAARDSGIPWQVVVDRRATDPDFRQATRWRF